METVSVNSKVVADFRANVADTMEARGMNQAALAERAGVTRVTINRLLNGHHVPMLDAAGQIAEALGVPLSLLLAEPRKKFSKAS